MSELILPALVAASALMLILWLVQLQTQNAGIVDVGWSFATALIGVWFALAWHEGEDLRKLLAGAMIGLWGLRLGLYLLRRMPHETEDGRYLAMRQRLGPWTQPVFFLFFQIQAAWALLFALPVLVAVSNPAPGLGLTDYLGVLVWLVALAGELVADRQLHRFRADPGNRGRVCDTGLWRYSRHPNYFFEWLHWWAYLIIGLGSPIWWLAWLVMALMLIFLLKITGIPHTERQALRSRGAAYRDYQRRTSVFIPLPPKKPGPAA